MLRDVHSFSMNAVSSETTIPPSASLWPQRYFVAEWITTSAPSSSGRKSAVQIARGDVLLLYTDGVTDAQNSEGAFFGGERLLEVVQAQVGHSAQDMQDALLAEIQGFVGDAPQFDDITLVVVARTQPV